MCYAFVKITENHFSLFLLAGMEISLYLCTRQTKGRAPAFGLTCTFDSVRGAKHVITRQTEGRAQAFGLTRTFDCVRGAAHVVTRESGDR